MINNLYLYKIIGSKLKKIREEDVQISQEEVAKKIGVTRTSISNIEKAKQRIPLSLLYSICQILNIEVKDILPTINELKNIEIKDRNIKVHSLLNSESLDSPALISIIKNIQTELKQNKTNRKKYE